MANPAPRPCRVRTCPKLQPCPDHPRRAFVALPAVRADRGRAWRVKREHVLRESPFCGWCARLGLQTYAVEVDHVIPVVEGGTDDLINLQGLCLAHHREKGGRDRARFWRRIREAGA